MKTTIEDVINQMVYEITIVKELNEIRTEAKKPSHFVDIIIFDLSCCIVNRFLGLTDWSDSHEDNLTVNKSDYTSLQIENIKNLRSKYRDFRNKIISHTTTAEVIANATVKDLENFLSAIKKKDVECSTTGFFRYFFNLATEKNSLRPALRAE